MGIEDALARARAAYAARAWSVAFDAYNEAEGAATAELEPDDLVRLATAAELTGRGGEGFARAHQAYLVRGDLAGAARYAFWQSMRLFNEGEHIRGRGWQARARRLVEQVPHDCPETGMVLFVEARAMLEEGNVTLAATTFEQVRQIGQRFGEPDLVAFALLGLASCRVRSGPPADGLACLDEVMIAVEAGEVSPVVAGILYCAVINLCHDVFDLRRAQEWTTGLTRWCAEQPDLVPFRGECQVHRSQILQLHGAWPAALDIAESVTDESAPRSRLLAIGPAYYQKAELHRLRGDFSQAEEAYRDASRWGHVPEPGLAQMRLAQGQPQVAAMLIARAIEEASQRTARARLLPAYVEIMLGNREIEPARAAADELTALAAELEAPYVAACAALAMGAVELAAGDARAALKPLREARALWQELDAPYEVARTRELIGQACRILGDAEPAQLELDAAAWTYTQLGATPDLARVKTPGQRTHVSGLSERELQVLRLLATGRSNRAIASELVLSEKTVARHISNIFTKLGPSSRAAATAYAYEHAVVS